MSNTYKTIIATLAVLVIAATSIFLIGQNRSEIKPVSTQSSSVISSVKSQVTISSSKVSLSSISSSVAAPVVSSVKTESQVALNSSINFQNCETLIGTDSIQVDGKCIDPLLLRMQ